MEQADVTFATSIASVDTNAHSVPMRVLYLRDAQDLYAGVKGNDSLSYATPQSVGLDLRACFDASLGDSIEIAPGERFAVPSGIAIELKKEGIAGFVYSRSGLGARKGVTVSQGVGVIDPDYRGEIIVSLLNTSQEPRVLLRGERMAQLVLQPYYRAVLETVDSLTETTRGSGGFGHTGQL